MGALKKRILVIDDQPIFLSAISVQLRSLGYTVKTASNGLEGIRLLHREKFDLVIVDMIMPEIGGTLVINVIRQEHPGIPILATSGYYDKLSNVLEDMEIEGILPKPIRFKDLRTTLDKTLSDKTRATHPKSGLSVTSS